MFIYICLIIKAVITLSFLKTLFKGVFGIIILFIVLGAVFGSDSSDNTETNSDISETASSSDEPVEEIVSTPEEVSTPEDTSGSDEPDKEIVSTSFSDFTPYFDSDSTELQKESFFDEHFKDKYVTWTGTVVTVSESFGSYSVQVKHSSKSLISDVYVKMRDDQKDNLLQLKEGSEITYTAKMTRYGEILGMSAEDGVIDSTDGTETNSDVSETTSSSDEPVEEIVSTPEDTSSSDESDKEIVSTSFSDFTPYFDPDSTELQKESFFDEHFKNKYVTWTGTVVTVSESYGSYSVQVKHSSKSLISDVYVKMRDDQKDNLLQLKEGSEITYTAKMTRYGEILGMSAEDGVIE